MVPKPSRNNSYCCVCKTPFEDYLTVPFILFSTSITHLISSLCENRTTISASKTFARSFPIKDNRCPEESAAVLQRQSKYRNCHPCPIWIPSAVSVTRRPVMRAIEVKKWPCRLWLDLFIVCVWICLEV